MFRKTIRRLSKVLLGMVALVVILTSVVGSVYILDPDFLAMHLGRHHAYAAVLKSPSYCGENETGYEVGDYVEYSQELEYEFLLAYARRWELSPMFFRSFGLMDALNQVKEYHTNPIIFLNKPLEVVQVCGNVLSVKLSNGQVRRAPSNWFVESEFEKIEPVLPYLKTNQA